MDVVVSGSSGLIGGALTTALAGAGHRVVRLTRGGGQGPGTHGWDPEAGTVDAAGLEGVGAVIHLAGEGIGARRWNEAHKARVLDSRVKGTTLLAETLIKLDRPPATWLSASAVGYYGDRGDESLTESSPPGTGFLADVCQAWEASTAPAQAAGIRVAHLRTGIVLSAQGGALAKMLRPFKLGAGGRMGSGRQWMSWISLADEVGAIVHLLGADGVRGPVNLTAPEPVRNADLAKALGRALHRPTVVPIPAFALRALLGAEMAQELLLAGQRVMPERLTASGYTFIHPDLASALPAALT